MKNVMILWLAAGTMAATAVIPLPKEVQEREGSFRLVADTGIRFDRMLAAEAAMLAAELKPLAGEMRTVREDLLLLLPSEIRLDVDDSLPLQAGGYTMEVKKNEVTIMGKDAAGAWNGTRTLLQMLPPGGDETIAAVSITDEPRFSWRGMHLDVGRHFFPVEDIRGFIDWLAFHKLIVHEVSVE